MSSATGTQRMESGATACDPQYVVLFSSDSPSTDNYKPIVEIKDLDLLLSNTLAGSYGLDPDIIAVIPALLYCLCLPRNRFDFLSVPLSTIKAWQDLDLPQHIILIPIPYPSDVGLRVDPTAPTILFYPDEIQDAAEEFSKGIPTLIDMSPISSLDQDLLRVHWLKLRTLFQTRATKLDNVPPLLSENRLRPCILPTFLLMRQFADTKTLNRLSSIQSKETALGYSLETQAVLSVARVFRNEGRASPTEAQFNRAVSAEANKFTCPVTVCMPGTSPRSSIRLLEKTGKTRVNEFTSIEVQELVFSFVATHRAIARSGCAIFTRDLDGEVFGSLAQLEQMWRDARLLKPAKIAHIMNTITKHVKSALDEGEEVSILHGRSLTVFSEFPIGLATLGTDTSPLTCRMPVAYRPLVPLTRTLQFELSSPAIRYVGDQLRVLILECIPRTDPVGRLSRVGWECAKESVSEDKQITWLHVEVTSLDELKKAISVNRADILVISAHGHYNRQSNYAGFVCGSDIVVGQDLGDLPPVVVLSSCQIWLRGSGAISVADILVRQGALAIIGTLIPIDVRKNALLMTRFFINVAAALRGEMPLRTIQDAWHFVTTSNAVNDILEGNRKLKEWSHKGDLETTVLYEFEQKRSIGRLRRAHIYRDSEQVLLEIARQRGIEETFQSWMKSPGYVPESAFYPVIGWPERIILNDPLVKEAQGGIKTA